MMNVGDIAFPHLNIYLENVLFMNRYAQERRVERDMSRKNLWVKS